MFFFCPSPFKAYVLFSTFLCWNFDCLVCWLLSFWIMCTYIHYVIIVTCLMKYKSYVCLVTLVSAGHDFDYLLYPLHPCVFTETYERLLKTHSCYLSLSGGGQGGGTRQLLSSLQKAVSRLVKHTVCRKTCRMKIYEMDWVSEITCKLKVYLLNKKKKKVNQCPE